MSAMSTAADYSIWPANRAADGLVTRGWGDEKTGKVRPVLR